MTPTWIDKLISWDYSITPVIEWLWNVVLYNAERHGPIAYFVAALVVTAILLSFPPTRKVTQTIWSSVFRMALLYLQLVISLLTVQLVGFLARVSLTLFHKARVWMVENVRRFRGTE